MWKAITDDKDVALSIKNVFDELCSTTATENHFSGEFNREIMQAILNWGKQNDPNNPCFAMSDVNKNVEKIN